MELLTSVLAHAILLAAAAVWAVPVPHGGSPADIALVDLVAPSPVQPSARVPVKSADAAIWQPGPGPVLEGPAGGDTMIPPSLGPVVLTEPYMALPTPTADARHEVEEGVEGSGEGSPTAQPGPEPGARWDWTTLPNGTVVMSPIQPTRGGDSVTCDTSSYMTCVDGGDTTGSARVEAAQAAPRKLSSFPPGFVKWW